MSSKKALGVMLLSMFLTVFISAILLTIGLSIAYEHGPSHEVGAVAFITCQAVTVIGAVITVLVAETWD